MSTLIQVYLTYDIALGHLMEANGLGADPRHDITTDSPAGERIQWLLAVDNPSNIASIDGIFQNPPLTDPPLFSREPTEGNGWIGEIHPGATLNKTYDYTINYTPSGTGINKPGDPQIKITATSDK